MQEKFQETFKEEAQELLNNLEQSLLELEEEPNNQDEISATFRAMHTIKGSAAMFGFQHISDFTHEVETIMDMLRAGKISATKELIDLTLGARDHIRELLAESEPPRSELAEKSQEIIQEYRDYIDRVGGSEGPQPAPAPVKKSEKPVESEEDYYHYPVIYRIRFKPEPGIFLNGTKPLNLLRELEELGDFTCLAHTGDILPLGEFDPEKCYCFWDIILTTKVKENAIRDVFIFVEDSSELDISIIDDLESIDEGPYRRLGEILTERGIIDSLKAEQAAQQQKRIGEMLVEEGVSEEEVQGALAEQEHVKRSRARVQTELSTSSIRVSSEKLDSLVDLVGEIVTLQARLSQTSSSINNSELHSISESFERLTAELRDHTMSARMLPIGTTFSKFRRLLRDISRDLGKEADIVTEGGETELDKTVIERLNDPLVHIIRNSVDHGIESPEEREAKGKPRRGQVRLSALHSGANVLIRVEDDGAGLDKERILEKAIDKKIISKNEELSDKEIYQLIFAPGFSTAKNVTNVSGRGVGMDVVKKEIENLNGMVDIESSIDSGTTIILQIPLTLAIIEGLLVEIGDESYVFPLSNVEECIELTKEMKGGDTEKRILNNRGEVLPYLRLREFFEMDGESPNIEQIVVVEAAAQKVGFVVDNVIGDHQTVIKNLGKMYRDLEGISGATILGDGSVALILDVQKLAAMAAGKE